MNSLQSFFASSGVWGLPGGYEIFIIIAIVLVIFGPKRLPALSRSIGQSITDFKRGLSGIKDDIETAGTNKTPTGEEKNFSKNS